MKARLKDSSTLWLASALLWHAVFVSPLQGAALHDLSRDFSLVSNPNGVWSYGSAEALGGPLSLCAFRRPSGSAWSPESWEFTEGRWPAVYHNATPNTLTSDGGQGSFPPGTVWYAAGEDGSTRNYAVIRFTAPAGTTGYHRLAVAAGSHLDGPKSSDADLHILKNGAEVFGANVPAQSRTGYTNAIRLEAGDTIDFALGRGADGLQYGSALKIMAAISPWEETPLAPFLVSQSPSSTVVAGANVTFSLQAGGAEPLSYQWYFQGAAIGGQTGDALHLQGVQTDQAGEYWAVVTNAQGSVTSSPVQLTVTEVPIPQTRAFNLERDFSIARNPAGAWSFGSAESLGGPLVPCAFARPAPSPNHPQSWEFAEGQWPAVYHNPGTNALVFDGGEGIYPPGAVWYAAGENGTCRRFGVIRFTVPPEVTGDCLLEVAVRSHLDGARSADADFHVLRNGVELFGRFLPPRSQAGYTNLLALTPGETLDFAIGRGEDGLQYGSALKIQVVVSPTTNTVLAPWILSQSRDQSAITGDEVRLTVEAGGTEPLAFQWFFNGAALLEATNNSLVISSAEPRDAGDYSVAVANAAGSVTSAPIALTVTETPPPPDPTSFDLSRDFSIGSNPNNPWSYGALETLQSAFQPCAYSRTGSGSGGIAIEAWEFTPGHWPAIYRNPTLETFTSDEGQGVFPPGAVWYAAGENGTSRNFGVIRFTAPAGLVGDCQVEIDVRSHLNGSRAGDTDFHVVRNGIELFGQFLPQQAQAGYTNILPMAAGDTLDLAIGRGLDGIQYGSGLKVQARIRPIASPAGEPVIVFASPGRSVAVGESVHLHVLASGQTPLTYQWSLDGEPIDGATNTWLTLTPVSPNHTGNYSVTVSNSIGSVTSAPIPLAVFRPDEAAPTITQQPQSQKTAAGGKIRFEVTATGSTPMVFRWSRNGTPLADATNSVLLIENAQPGVSGTYWVVVSNPFGSVTSASAVASVETYEGGTVLFANYSGTNRAFVFDTDGVTKLEGAQNLVQLYAGPDEASLQPLGAAIPFLEGSLAGLFYGGARYIPSVPPGSQATVIVKAWAVDSGPTYEQAVANGGKTGASPLFTVITGGGSPPPPTPPPPPALLVGLQSFALAVGSGPPPVAAMPLSAPAARLRPSMTLPVVQSDGQVSFHVEAELGSSCVVEASSDGITWIGLTTLRTIAGSTQVTDRTAAGTSQRFYRVRMIE